MNTLTRVGIHLGTAAGALLNFKVHAFWNISIPLAFWLLCFRWKDLRQLAWKTALFQTRLMAGLYALIAFCFVGMWLCNFTLLVDDHMGQPVVQAGYHPGFVFVLLLLFGEWALAAVSVFVPVYAAGKTLWENRPAFRFPVLPRPRLRLHIRLRRQLPS